MTDCDSVSFDKMISDEWWQVVKRCSMHDGDDDENDDLDIRIGKIMGSDLYTSV